MGTTAAAATGPGWQLDEDAPRAYERYLVPAIFAEASRRLVAAAGVGRGDAVLDAACGTAVVARRAAAVVGAEGSVTAVDVNGAMLAVAAAVSSGTVPRIGLVEADVTALPFEDGRFDVALIQEALQFVDDPVATLAEIARVTRPGGTVAASTFRGLEHHPVYAVLVDALARHVGDEAAATMASPFSFGTAATLRATAVDAGLVDVRVTIAVGVERFASVAAMVQQEAASSPLAHRLRSLRRPLLDTLVADVQQRLAPWCDDDGLCFANETHVLVAAASER